MIYTLNEGVNRSREKLENSLVVAVAVLMAVVITALVAAAPSFRRASPSHKNPLSIYTLSTGQSQNQPSSNKPPAANAASGSSNTAGGSSFPASQGISSNTSSASPVPSNRSVQGASSVGGTQVPVIGGMGGGNANPPQTINPPAPAPALPLTVCVDPKPSIPADPLCVN